MGSSHWWHRAVTWDCYQGVFDCLISLRFSKERKKKKDLHRVISHVVSLGAGRWSANLADL